jgi:hypothetical protein
MPGLRAVGCGQHHPLVAAQQQVLRRRLQQLRADSAAAAAAWQPSQHVVYAYADGGGPAENQQPTAAASSNGDAHPAGIPVVALGADNSNQRRPAAGPQQQQQTSKAGAQQQQGGKAPAQHLPLPGMGRVSPAKLRISAQYQLSGLSAAEQRRVKQQLVPGAIKVLQRYIKVSSCDLQQQWGWLHVALLLRGAAHDTVCMTHIVGRCLRAWRAPLRPGSHSCWLQGLKAHGPQHRAQDIQSADKA